jgi:sialidase-1
MPLSPATTAFLAGIALATAAAASPALPALTNVFVDGQEGYLCFRIPAIVLLPNGSLAAFGEGRKFNCDDHGWVDLVMKVAADGAGGKAWYPLTKVYGESTKAQNVTTGNPAPVVVPAGGNNGAGFLLLPFSRNNLEIGFMRSDDFGTTWTGPSYPSSTFPKFVWVATGPPGSLALPSGRILVPIDLIVGKNPYSSASVFSDDGGVSWTMSANNVPGGNECQAALMPWLNDTTLFLSMRSAVGGNRFGAISVDGGNTWSRPWNTIVETQCEASTISLPKHPNGPLLVMSSAFNSGSRVNMTIHVSADNGHSWTPRVQVYPGGSAYSALIALPSISSSTVGLLFERDNYQSMAYCQVDL